MADQKIPGSQLPLATEVNDVDGFIGVQSGRTKLFPFALVSQLIAQGHMVTNTFTNANLDGDGNFVLNHGLNTQYVLLNVFNPDGIWQSNLWWRGDAAHANTQNNVTMAFGGPIDAGNWLYELLYWNAGSDIAEDVLFKTINIGAWDMANFKSSTPVAHGIADHTKIIDITVYIYNDMGTGGRTLTGNFFKGDITHGDTTVGLIIPTYSAGGPASSSLGVYTNAYVNRGYITIKYKP